MRAQRRRESNRERKKVLERRQQKEAEALRIKHEGPSLAELVCERMSGMIYPRLMMSFLMTAKGEIRYL